MSQLGNFEAYAFIKIDLGQRFPRVFSCREVVSDGARYFGPFKSRRAVEATVDIIQQLFQVRTCTRSFEWEVLNRKKRLDPPCLRLSIHRCPGPCTGKYSEGDHAEYMQIIEEVISFLNGEKQVMLDTLWERIQKSISGADFERAGLLRDSYQQAEKIIGSQKFLAAAVEGNNIIIALPSVEPRAVELLCIYRGRLGRQFRLFLDKPDAEAQEELAGAWEELVAKELGLAATHPNWSKRGGRVIGQEAVDEINIIARWLYSHGEASQESPAGTLDQLIIPIPPRATSL